MYLVTIADLNVSLSTGCFRQHALRTGQHLLKLARPSDMVSVYVSVENQLEVKAHLPSHVRVSKSSFDDRIDDDRLKCAGRPRICREIIKAAVINTFTTGSPFLGTTLLGYSIGRGSGALKVHSKYKVPLGGAADFKSRRCPK